MIKRIFTTLTLALILATGAKSNEIVVDFRSPDFAPVVSVQTIGFTIDGVGVIDPDEIDPNGYTWSPIFGLGQIPGPVVRYGQAPVPGPSTFTPKGTMDFGVSTPVTGIWIHELPSIWGVGAIGSMDGVFRPDSVEATLGPENRFGNALLSFATPVKDFEVESEIVDYSVIAFVNDQEGDGGRHGHSVPDGGSTLMLFATGLLALMGMKIIRKRTI